MAAAAIVALFGALVAPAGAQVSVDQPSTALPEDSGPGGVSVRQRPPEVEVIERPPSVSVRQPDPIVEVEPGEPTVEVEQREPRVEVTQPPPEVEVQQAPPRVTVEQRPPQVTVRQGEPEVSFETEDAQVEITTETPRVVVEREPAEIVIERAPGPGLTFEALRGKTLYLTSGEAVGTIVDFKVERRTGTLSVVTRSGGLFGFVGGTAMALPHAAVRQDDGTLFIDTPHRLETLAATHRYEARHFDDVPPEWVVR